MKRRLRPLDEDEQANFGQHTPCELYFLNDNETADHALKWPRSGWHQWVHRNTISLPAVEIKEQKLTVRRSDTSENPPALLEQIVKSLEPTIEDKMIAAFWECERRLHDAERNIPLQLQRIIDLRDAIGLFSSSPVCPSEGVDFWMRCRLHSSDGLLRPWGGSMLVEGHIPRAQDEYFIPVPRKRRRDAVRPAEFAALAIDGAEIFAALAAGDEGDRTAVRAAARRCIERSMGRALRWEPVVELLRDALQS